MRKLTYFLRTIIVIICIALIYSLFVDDVNKTELYVNEYKLRDGQYSVAIKNAIDRLISYDRNNGCIYDGEDCKIDVFFENSPDVIDCMDSARLFEPKILIQTHHTSWRGHRDDNLGVALKGVCIINEQTCYIYDEVALDSLFAPTGEMVMVNIETSNSVVYCEEIDCWILKDIDNHVFEYVMNSYLKDSCLKGVSLSSTDEEKIDEYVNAK